MRFRVIFYYFSFQFPCHDRKQLMKMSDFRRSESINFAENTGVSRNSFVGRPSRPAACLCFSALMAKTISILFGEEVHIRILRWFVFSSVQTGSSPDVIWLSIVMMCSFTSKKVWISITKCWKMQKSITFPPLLLRSPRSCLHITYSSKSLQTFLTFGFRITKVMWLSGHLSWTVFNCL